MSVKSRGGKRLRRRPAVSGSGVRREDERVWTTADAPKSARLASKPEVVPNLRDKGAPVWCALSRGATCVWPRWCPV